jgi:hypothetical protein
MERSSRGSSAALGWALAIAIALSGDASAHRLDEYLQAARIDIDLPRVALALEMTPGVEVADAVIAAIDRDRNGVFSPDEQSTYARLVLNAIQLKSDGTPLRVQLTSSSFPEPAALRGGEAIIQLQSAADLPRLNEGPHRLFYRNTHRRDMSVYLVNALVPQNARVEITGQTRDTAQTELRIDYVVHAAARPQR